MIPYVQHILAPARTGINTRISRSNQAALDRYNTSSWLAGLTLVDNRDGAVRPDLVDRVRVLGLGGRSGTVLLRH